MRIRRILTWSRNLHRKDETSERSIVLSLAPNSLPTNTVQYEFNFELVAPDLLQKSPTTKNIFKLKLLVNDPMYSGSENRFVERDLSFMLIFNMYSLYCLWKCVGTVKVTQHVCFIVYVCQSMHVTFNFLTLFQSILQHSNGNELLWCNQNKIAG